MSPFSFKLVALSGLVGILATGENASIAASVAENATQNNFLGQKVQNNEPLTDIEQALLADSYQQYYDEMAMRFGAGFASASLDGLKQNGVIPTYGYPYVGTPEQKADWTAANSQTFWGSLKTAFRSSSEDEDIYRSLDHSEQIKSALEKDAEIGQVAMLVRCS